MSSSASSARFLVALLAPLGLLAASSVVAACHANVGLVDFPFDASVDFDANVWSSSSGGASGSSGGTASSSGGTPNDGGARLDASSSGGSPGDASPPEEGDGATFQCTANTCVDGCCQNDVCITSTATTCGTHGIACQDCSASSEVCSASGQCGTSISSCSSLTCSDGCCSGDVCVVAIAPTSCGPVGVACIDCTRTNQVCSTDGNSCVDATDGGTSPLEDAQAPDGQAGDAAACAATCAGCCDSSGVCQPGTSDSACGETGTSCLNCTATGQTCFQILNECD